MSQNNVNDCNANQQLASSINTYDELENTCMVVLMLLLISSVKPVNYLVHQCPVTLSKSNGTPEFGAEGLAPSAVLVITFLVPGFMLSLLMLHLNQRKRKLFLGLPTSCTPLCECCITFNDLVAARFDSAHLDFWAATVPASKQAGYAQIGAALPSAGKEIMPVCNLPLPFF